MNNIIVTGGAGNVGSSLVNALLESNYNVLVLDNLSTGSLDNLDLTNDRLTFIEVNVNNRQELYERIPHQEYKYVFHYAALVGVKRTQENPLKVLDDINGFKNILDLCLERKVERIFFSSSSEVYGEPVTIPQNEETTPLNSRVPYAIVKNVGESYCKSYKKEHGLDYTILRFFNTYGPNQTTDFVISKFLKQAIENQDITIYGDGSQTRTFCYIDDNIETTLKLIEKNKGINEIINLGDSNIISIIDLAKLIIEITNSSSQISFLPPLEDGDMTRRQPDNTKMLQILQRPLTTLKKGISLILEKET